jgi:predicted alpha/beta-fold hydrolase
LTPSITRYIAPRWLPGGHAQTIWPLLRKGPLPDLRRERWDTPDGDFIDLDWLPHRPGAPLVVLFHGLEGSSESPYARSLMRMLTRLGWNGVVPHFRGCSGEPNRLPRAYHSGDADEIGWILERLATLHPQLPRYAAGVSLGGNALLLWLGTRRRDACQTIHAAAAVCPPLDMAAAGHNLSKGFNASTPGTSSLHSNTMPQPSCASTPNCSTSRPCCVPPTSMSSTISSPPRYTAFAIPMTTGTGRPAKPT